MLPDVFLLFSFPCSADHERDWPPCKVVLFGLATNTLNVRNNNISNNNNNNNMFSRRHLAATSSLYYLAPADSWTDKCTGSS